MSHDGKWCEHQRDFCFYGDKCHNECYVREKELEKADYEQSLQPKDNRRNRRKQRPTVITHYGSYTRTSKKKK